MNIDFLINNIFDLQTLKLYFQCLATTQKAQTVYLNVK